MSSGRKERTVVAPVWGIFLTFLGVILLLQTLNVLPWELWQTLWQFWPVLIIIIGVGILLRHWNAWLVSLLVILLLGASLGTAIWQYSANPGIAVTTKNYLVPLDSLQSANVRVNFAAGTLNIGSLPVGAANLVDAEYEVRNGEPSMKTSFTSLDGQGSVGLDTSRMTPAFWNKGGVIWKANFARGVPLTLDIKADATSTHVDLSGLKVTGFRLDADVGNCQVIMPSSGGATAAFIKTDVSNIEVIIPAGVAARVRVTKDLSALDIDQTRFPKKGDVYVSPDYDAAQNRVDLEIDSDVGRVAVK